MIIESQRQVRCRGCQEVFTVYKYMGMDGNNWGHHLCETQLHRLALLNIIMVEGEDTNLAEDLEG